MRRHAKAIVAISAMLLTLALGATVAGAIAPTVTVDNAENVDYTTADVKGTVDPGDKETSFHFEASPAADFSSDVRFTGFGGFPAGGGSQPTPPAEFTGLKPGTTYHLRLVASNEEGSDEAVAASTFATDPLPLPTVTIAPVTVFTDDGSTFSGTINPNAPGSAPFPGAADVQWHFECTPACPGLPGPQEIDADATNHEVEVDVSGLDPNVSYEVRLIATNAGGQQSAEDSTTFSTSAVAPIVKTLPPAVITESSAWIGAKVNPQNTPTTYYIEYSSNPGFASSIKVPVSEDASVGAGNSLVLVNHHAEGLQPGATYYYRVVASGSGETAGDTESFVTRTNPITVRGLPDGRVYEKVSPADKNGGAVFSGAQSTVTVKAAHDGDAVAFGGASVSFGGDGGAIFPQYLAKRGPTGWSTQGVSPRKDPVPEAPTDTIFSWFSEDLSLGLTSTQAVLNPGDLNDFRNLYLRDNVTGRFTTIVSPEAGLGGGVGDRSSIEGVSGDERHFVYLTSVEDEDPSRPSAVWEWAAEGQRPVSVLPNGSLTKGEIGGGNPGQLPGTNAVSMDGSRVYWGSAGSLYVRDFSGSVPQTIPLSISEGTSNSGELSQGKFELASQDGTTAFFSAGTPLTDQSSQSQSLYRWRLGAEPGSRLTDLTADDLDQDPRFLGVAGASNDARTVYFAAAGRLTPEAISGAANLYVWKEGVGVDLVANLRNDEVDGSAWSDQPSFLSDDVYRQARVTPDGRYIAFVTQEALTAYDTNGTPQMYLYDSQEAKLLCISCGAVEPKASGGAWFASGAYKVGTGAAPCCSADPLGYLPRNLSPDGSRIVFDSNDPLVSTDSNGVLDVYQWKDGKLSLISAGTSGAPSRLLDVSADGDDIFFTTAQRLVLSDSDSARDLYDARVGGTSEPTPIAPCVADECQGTPSPPPSFPTPASAGFQGQGNVKDRKPRCRKGRVHRGGRCITNSRKKVKNTRHANSGRSH